MSRIRVSPVAGFPEWQPDLRLAEQRLIATIQDVYELYGFSPIQTPAVERLEILNAKGGMSGQVYSLREPEGDDRKAELGLRFDLTVPLARYVAAHAENLRFPFRRYHIDKVWRREPAERDGFREFYQCDIDIIGRTSLDPIHDAEIPCVINAVFDALNLSDFQIHFCNRRVFDGLLEALGCDRAHSNAVLTAIDESHRRTAEETRNALERVVRPEQIDPILKFVACKTIAGARDVLAGARANLAGLEEMERVLKNANALGMPEDRLRPDFTTARDLDYYTGTVYETFVAGKEGWGSICSGGRYDDLAGVFSAQKYPGVGVSIQLSRLIDLLSDSDMLDTSVRTPTKVLVTTTMEDRDKYMPDYLGIANTLRRERIPTEVYLEKGSLHDQIDYASAKGIPLAVIAGAEQLDKDTVLLRDLRHHSKDVSVTGDSLVREIRKKLGTANTKV